MTYEVAPQAKDAATYGTKIYMASVCCSDARLVHAPLLRATPRSRPSPHRFGPVQASPALCPCDPRRLPGVKQAVPMDKNLNHWSSYAKIGDRGRLLSIFPR